VNWPAWSSVASAATTLWPALCRVFAYAAPGLPRLQMRSGREDIGVSSVGAAAESGVSTREGGVCRCLARRAFFFGVEGVEDVVATELGDSALTEDAALSVATASCREPASSDSEIVSRSAPSIFGDVIFDIFGSLLLGLVKHCCFLSAISRDRGLMYSMASHEFMDYIIGVCWLSHRRPYPAMRSQCSFIICEYL
jgi:hypothetical protein